MRILDRKSLAESYSPRLEPFLVECMKGAMTEAATLNFELILIHDGLKKERVASQTLLMTRSWRTSRDTKL